MYEGIAICMMHPIYIIIYMLFIIVGYSNIYTCMLHMLQDTSGIPRFVFTILNNPA